MLKGSLYFKPPKNSESLFFQVIQLIFLTTNFFFFPFSFFCFFLIFSFADLSFTRSNTLQYYNKMRFSSAILLGAVCWIQVVTAHNIALKAHSRECFHEDLHRDDKMTVTFQVGDREFGGSGNLEIDFWVCPLN